MGTQITLTAGFYKARSKAAAAQTCLNIFPEVVPDSAGEDTGTFFSQRPGLKTHYTDTTPNAVRGLYSTSRGDVIAVIGSNVIRVNEGGGANFLGRIDDGATLIRMKDNGETLFIVDGTTGGGWYCSIPEGPGDGYGQIFKVNDEAFYGSNTIAFLDGFFIFNKPGSRHFYVSPSDYSDNKTTPFDGTYIATPDTKATVVMGVETVAQSLLIFGQQSVEIWYNSGAADFPFARNPGVLIEAGCAASYSIAKINGTAFWLSKNESGCPNVYSYSSNGASKISSQALDNLFLSYGDLSGAYGSTYSEGGHDFYVLSLPTVGKTWVFDVTTNAWHERNSCDPSGNVIPYDVRFFACSAYGTVYAGANNNSGVIYKSSISFIDDDGIAFNCSKSFMHMRAGGNRVRHNKFVCNIQSTLNPAPGVINVSFSDDRGVTFSNNLSCPASDAYPSLWRLGIARDRVYLVSYVSTQCISLLGAYVDVVPTNN